MAAKEAKARIKINKLLEESGWRFFDEKGGKANVVLEPNVKLTKEKVDELGENFETTSNGFIDFLLLDEQGYPLVVLEAKAEDKKSLADRYLTEPLDVLARITGWDPRHPEDGSERALPEAAREAVSECDLSPSS